ncbi:hypothetical protein [Actinomadura sp. BRA 177]|uniref:hypothetical protein n=1 Tax=Actinomadura sp. BRA 177 TaxID=2745202 RepID=UPI0015956DF1|nr:hypothetical protein [Actinomadura sp. BRA 177]NVI88676.1 hypothetical protein [Actinomadura sp. BRA 177]
MTVFAGSEDELSVPPHASSRAHASSREFRFEFGDLGIDPVHRERLVPLGGVETPELASPLHDLHDGLDRFQDRLVIHKLLFGVHRVVVIPADHDEQAVRVQDPPPDHPAVTDYQVAGLQDLPCGH